MIRSKKYLKLIFSEEGRTQKLKKNVFYSTMLQLLSMGASFLLLPVALSFVSIEEYGLWLVINSILVWIERFDFGVGTGLKNKLTEALATNNYTVARGYLSTAYIIIVVMIILTISVLYILISLFDLSTLINYDSINHKLVELTIYVVLGLLSVRIALQFIYILFESMQLLYLSKLTSTISQIASLILVIIMSEFVSGNIFYLSVILIFTPITVLVVVNIFFYKKYLFLIPSLRYFSISNLKDIFGLGTKFFIIQTSMLFVSQSNNLLINNYLGSKEVVQFNVANSLFSMMLVVFSNIAAPFWSANTNAWVMKDIAWITKFKGKLFKVWLMVVACGLVVLSFSEQIYSIWTQKELDIPFALSSLLFIYYSVFSFGYIYNMLINAVGKLFIQVIFNLMIMFLFYPMFYFFYFTLKMELLSFPLLLILTSTYYVLIAPWHYSKLIHGVKEGIFYK